MKRYEYKLESVIKGHLLARRITLSLRCGYIWVGNDDPSQRTFVGTITNKRTLRAIGKRLLEITKQA